MNIFRKLFGRKKNTINLTAEEAYAPEAAPAPEEKPADRPEAVFEAPAAPAEAPQSAEVNAPAAEETAPQLPKTDKSCVIYACLDDPASASEFVRPFMRERFSSLLETSDGFEGEIASDIQAEIDVRPDTEDKKNADRLYARFEKAPLMSRDVLNAALMQLSLFNVSFRVDISGYEGSFETSAVDFINALAGQLKGFVTYDEDAVYRWDGKKLLGADGSTDFTEFMPVRCSAATYDEVKQDSVSARRARSESLIKQHGIEETCDCEVKADEDSIALKPAEDALSRACALFMTSLTAHAYTSPREVAAPAAWCQSLNERFESRYGVMKALSPKENAYRVSPSPSAHAGCLKKAEACAVILWALGLYELKWADTPAELSSLNEVFKDSSFRTLVSKAAYRSPTELLDMYDLTVRLHALSVRMSLSRLRESGIDPDIVYERHYALNWLLGVGGDIPWDSIVPST